MTRFKSKLIGTNKERVKLDPSITPIKVFSPANCEELRIPFRTDKIAKVVGKLAQTHQLPLHLRNNDGVKEEGGKKAKAEEETTRGITGVLVQNEFKLSLMAPEDLKEYAGLTTTTIVCREHLTLRAAGAELIRWALQAAFGEVLEISKTDSAINGKLSQNGYKQEEEAADEEISRSTKHFLVMSTVHILLSPGGAITVEWEGNMLNDGIADAVLGVLLSVETSPAAIRQSSSSHSHSHGASEEKEDASLVKRAAQAKARELDPKERLSRLFLLLEAQFGTDVTPIHNPRRKTPTSTSSSSDTIEPDDPELTDLEVQATLQRLHTLGIPVPGIAINVGGQIVNVWLDDMSVESVTAKSAVLKQRVEMVVREAVECVAPLWG